MDIRGLFGRKVEVGEFLGTRGGGERPKWKNLGGVAELLHPSASVGVRGNPRFVWADAGSWELVRIKRGRIPKCQKLGRNGQIIASASFRQIPWTSAVCVAAYGIWGIFRSRGEERLKWLKIGRNGQIIASACFRGLPSASAAIRGLCGRKMEDGKFLGEKGGKTP